LGEIVSYLSGKLFLSNTEICCRSWETNSMVFCWF